MLFQFPEQTLHEAYGDRVSASAGLVVGLALVALPYFHVSNLGRSASLKIFLDDVSPDKVELQLTLRTLQENLGL